MIHAHISDGLVVGDVHLPPVVLIDIVAHDVVCVVVVANVGVIVDVVVGVAC